MIVIPVVEIGNCHSNPIIRRIVFQISRFSEIGICQDYIISAKSPDIESPLILIGRSTNEHFRPVSFWLYLIGCDPESGNTDHVVVVETQEATFGRTPCYEGNTSFMINIY